MSIGTGTSNYVTREGLAKPGSRGLGMLIEYLREWVNNIIPICGVIYRVRTFNLKITI